MARPCPDGFAEDISCWTIELPADRSDPAAGSVVLPVAVAPALGPNPEGRALVIPSGGPGDPGLGLVTAYAELPVRATHDIVTYDQRGTGAASPSLECPERDEVAVATLQAAAPATDEQADVAAAMLACRARLVAAGVDLDDYDSEASAADLDDLRRALGRDRWSILGISYGARLALATMRAFPDGIESVVLDSIYDVVDGGMPATLAAADRGIRHLVDACAADAACNERYPDLGRTIDVVRERYNAEPWHGTASRGPGEPPEGFVITGDDIVAGLFRALYDSTLIPILPSVLVALSNGDTSLLPALVEQSIPGIIAAADAMGSSVDCADNAGIDRYAEREAAAFAGTADRFSTVLTQGAPPCAAWDVPPTPGDFNEPVTSGIPALVLAGSFDPVTQPETTRVVAERLDTATFALFPNIGHGVTGNGECQTAMLQQFLADPATPVDTSCVSSLTGPEWA